MAQTAAKFSEGPDSLSHTQPEENNKRRSVAYLGRGLDATKPPESWCSKLDGYDVEPVIDTTEIKDGKFVEAHGVAQSRPFYAKDVNSARKKVQVERCNSFKSQSASDIVVDFAEHPTASALIRGESKRGLWLCKKQSASETVSLRRDDTDCEPSDETDVTTYTDYSKFERELYEHIANEMNLAVESDTDSIEAVKELDGAIGRNEISEGEEQELAKACYSFIEGKQVTHYVHSITLGTAFGGLSNFRFSWIKPKALLIRKLEEMTESELAIGDHTNFHPQRPQKQFLSKSFCGMMGELTSEGGEAIIECSIKPISTLVTMKSLGDFFRKELSLYAKNQIFGMYHVMQHL